MVICVSVLPTVCDFKFNSVSFRKTLLIEIPFLGL